jgi:TorA maturation chaperone TorD
MDTVTPDLLRRAAKYRALALLFAPPEESFGVELRALAKDLAQTDGDDRALGEALTPLAEDAGEPLARLYHCAMGPTGAVRDCESDYEVNPLGGKGPMLADVAGFYLAFKFEDRGLEGTSPDHVSNELGFLSWMAFRSAFARHEGDLERAAICDDASEKFASEHLGKWAATFFARVRERCPQTWYDEAARVAEDALRALEPGRLAPVVEDQRKVALPVMDDGSDECGLPPDA